jgi:uncharacterized protein YrzB (UPF0473 family)
MDNKRDLNDPISQLFDPNNRQIITLYDTDGESTQFEKVAAVLVNKEPYAILHPVVKMATVNENDAFVFAIDEKKGEFNLEHDEKIIDQAFAEYRKLFKAQSETK